MATGFGTNAWLGFGEESTYLTPVAPTKFVEIMEESVAGKHNWISRPTLRSASQNQRVRSKKSVEGGLKMNLGFEGAERLLKHAIGSLATSGVGPYTQTYSLATALPTGLTLHVNRDAASVGAGSAFQYSGCQISKLTLKQAVEDLLTAEIDFLGGDWLNVAVATPTFPTFYQIDWEMLSTFTINSVAVNVQEFEITIENQLANDRYKLGARTRLGLGRQGPRKISGKFTAEFDSLTTYTLYQTLSTPVTLSVFWTNGLSAGNLKTLTITANVVLKGKDPTVKDAGPINVEFEFEAFQNAAANDELSVVLVNSVSTP